MNDGAFASALSRAAAQVPLLRSCAPEETLETIAPALASCGITRSASVTYLDTLGIPVWISVRPGGLVLQISNGKGITDAAAQVSALMEACELHLAENPEPDRLWHGSMVQLARHDPVARIVTPVRLPCHIGGYFSPDFVGEWTFGTDLATGDRIWAPSSAVYFYRRPVFFETSSNGLASGNTRAEARLHALYELIERDATYAPGPNGQLSLRERGQVIDPDTVPFSVGRLMIDRCVGQGTRVILALLPAAVPITVIRAILLSERTTSTRTLINLGYGAHVRPEIALNRALTEAAQSRLAKIHGAREDIRDKLGAPRDSRTYRAVDRLAHFPGVNWEDVLARPRLDIPDTPEKAVGRIVRELLARNKGPLYEFDLSKADRPIHCARIIAPSLACNGYPAVSRRH